MVGRKGRGGEEEQEEEEQAGAGWGRGRGRKVWCVCVCVCVWDDVEEGGTLLEEVQGEVRGTLLEVIDSSIHK